MAEIRTKCSVCGAALPTGDRGRPRVVCSDRCYNARRSIRSTNQESLSIAQAQMLRVVQSLAAWPELQIEGLSLFSAIRGTSDEVTKANVESSKEAIDMAKAEELIN